MRKKTEFATCPPPYSVERAGRHSAVVTLAENAVEVTRGQGEDAITSWEADVYILTVPYTPGLEARIEANYAAWLAHAKAEDYEAAAEEIRSHRDMLLEDTDYVMYPDYPASSERTAAMQTYRQALRDVPGQSGFPHDVVWPKIGQF